MSNYKIVEDPTVVPEGVCVITGTEISGYTMTIWMLFALNLPLTDCVVLLVGIKVKYLRLKQQ